MSEPQSEQRKWRFYLDDMIAFAQKVRDYTEEQDLADFLASGLT